MRCLKKDCGKEAAWSITMLLFARGYPNAPPARAMLQNVGICSACKKAAQPEDFITDDGWEKICRGFLLANKAMPERKRVQLEFKPIL